MRQTTQLRDTLLPAFLLLVGAVPELRAQEPPPRELPAQNDPIEELRRLFREVETSLERIDVQLADAGAGDAPLEEVADSGIEKLLRDSQQEASKALANIDRILEIASQIGSQSRGRGSAGEEPQPGESPLDKQRGEGPLDRERTPEAPGERPEQAEREGQPKSPSEGAQESPAQSRERGENRGGQGRPDEPGTAVPPGEDSDPWGFLPARAQEVFRNQGSAELPMQYRDWIDSYYRRLNARRR